jgi:hypothetical protein
MRTTLDIDEDILMAAKSLARHRNLSAGQVVSQLLRKALTGEFSSSQPPAGLVSEGQTITGFRPFPAGKAIVTNDVVNNLRETESV